MFEGIFDPQLAIGYPTMYGRFADYAGSGYRTACAWIQVIRSAFYDDLAADEPVIRDTETDLSDDLREGGVPFFAFGYLPDIYDAPANNLRDFARMSWQADTFLVTMPTPWNGFSVACLAAFRWGYWDALVEGVPSGRPYAAGGAGRHGLDGGGADAGRGVSPLHLPRLMEEGAPMDEIIYRLATRDDADQLAELRWIHEAENGAGALAAGYPAAGDRAAFAGQFRAFVDRELGLNYACWVAETGGRLVSNVYIGMMNKVPKPGGEATRIGYVTNVHTLAEYRNRGIGSRLMRQVQAWARRSGFELLFVWPSERSIPFYERLGFDGDNDVMECSL